ncbi:MAG: hypothetical protein JXA20_02475 [Spirochaetes bacterium]|nr:hypothetical protein [Spirochaetota bacterium]
MMPKKTKQLMMRAALSLVSLAATAGAIAQAPPSAFLSILNRHPVEIGAAEQVMIVTTAAPGHHALLYSYQLVKGSWQVQFIPFWASMGKRGFAPGESGGAAPLETPRGIFTVAGAFGTDAPPATGLDYRQEPMPTFNVPGGCADSDPPAGKRRDYYSSRLQILLVSREQRDRQLTIHLWPHQRMYTAGSIGISELSMRKLLRWLEKGKSPMIITGPADYIRDLK